MNRCTVAGMTNQFPLLLVDGQCAVCNQPLCGGREITLVKIRLVGVVERRTAYFHLLVIPEAGCGVYALLVALTHPEMRVTAYETDEEKYLTAARCAGVPENLTYICGRCEES